MGGSDYASDSSAGSYGSAGSKKKYKKDKKDKKEKKDKDPKDKDKKEKKDKEKKDKEKDKDKDGKHKEEKDKDKKKDKEKDKHKDGKDKKHGDSAQASSSYSYPGQQPSTGPISVPAFNPNYPGASAGVAGHGMPNLGGTGYHNPVSSSGAAPVFPSAPQPPSIPQPSLLPGQVPNMSYDQQPPPSGYRTPLDSHGGKPFPTDFQEIGPPVTHDLDGSPIYIGSVLFDNAVHPCKIGPHLNPPAQVAYGGVEQGHSGRYDLLPFVQEQMEWVPTSHGQIPHGRRPVEGGYEEGGEKLYHALAPVNGVKVPGKTGVHLGGANVGFGGGEHGVQDNYEILCWRY